METLPHLQNDPQSLTIAERASALAQCHAVILQIEASQALDSVRDVETPGFQFKSKSLQRLKILIESFSKDGVSDRIRGLQDSDPELVIVYGLSMTTRDINRMSDKMWSEIRTQAGVIASRLAPNLAQNQQISHTINNSSNNEFKITFENLQKDHCVFNQIPRILVDGQYCYHYIAPPAPRLMYLADLALAGRVAIYIPELELDGLLRITTRWDEGFLNGLFLYQNQNGIYDAAGFMAISNRARVAQYLGEYISRAIETSQTRAMEPPDSPTTTCVKCRGFPGQVIMVDVTIARAECIDIMLN